MPRSKLDRARGFVFYPDDYLNDPMVRRMTCLGRGAYSSLLFELWRQPEPGVVLADDRLLVQLAACTSEEWASVRGDVAMNFDTEGRPGWWIQKRMTLGHQARQRLYNARKTGGMVGAKRRWGNGEERSGTNDPMGHGSPNEVTSNEVTSNKEETHPLANGHASRAVDPERLRVAREWREAFEKHFWPAYPRKVKRKPALVAWMKLVRGRTYAELEKLLGRILGGLEWCADDEWAKREPDKIPHAATFINAEQWEDAFDGEEDENAGESRPAEA